MSKGVPPPFRATQGSAVMERYSNQFMTSLISQALTLALALQSLSAAARHASVSDSVVTDT